MKLIDITGKKFNRLVAIKKVDGKRWLFKCDCGKEKVIDSYCVRKGITKSCGCYNSEASILRETTHGLRKTSEYHTWSSMKRRCNLKTSNKEDYILYAGRGIIVCDRWLNSFENFIEDMGMKPTPKHSIDRIDNNKGYYKENCRWATNKQQSRNKRNNFYVAYNNETKTLTEWCEILNLNYKTIRNRLKISKWDVKKAFETPISKQKCYN